MEIKNTRIGAYGVIIHDSKVALVKKAIGGYKGKFDLPGGGIEHNETPTDALEREILEEAGIYVDSYSLIDVYSVNINWEVKKDLFEDLHHIGILYQVNVSDLELKKDADGLDSDGADWYEIDKLEKENLTPFARYGLEKLGYKIK